MTNSISRKSLLAMASVAATAGAGLAAAPANAETPPTSAAPVVTETLSAAGVTPDAQGDLTAALDNGGVLDVSVGYGIVPATTGPSGTPGPSGSLDCGVPGDTPTAIQVGQAGFSGVSVCTYRTPGTYVVSLKATDNLTPAHLSSITRTVTVTPIPAVPVDRYDGATRYGTGVALSQAEFPVAGSAGAVVLARGDVFADALAGIPLAKAKNGPLLLTPGGAGVTQLDSDVQAELLRVLPHDHNHTVYVLGGLGAIPQPVQDRIAGLGYTVVRLAGASRFQTALTIAQDPRALDDPAHVVLARGDDYADALAAGPLAANGYKDSHGTPAAIVLSDGPATAATVDPATAAYVRSKMTAPVDRGASQPASLTGNVVAVGGGAKQAAAGLGGATEYEAFTGSDRFDTARLVAVNGWQAPASPITPQPHFQASRLGLAAGTSFPDALTGGAYMALEDGPLLLSTARNIPITTYATIRQAALTGHVGQIAAFGGPAVLWDVVVKSETATAVYPYVTQYTNHVAPF